jgi:hypothetical protein
MRKKAEPIPGKSMSLPQYRAKFNQQRTAARRSGIDWQITFEEWYEWWGDDIDRRGKGHGNVQMQRVLGTGPISLSNIRKGYPNDNTNRCANIRSTVKAKFAAERKERFSAAVEIMLAHVDEK